MKESLRDLDLNWLIENYGKEKAHEINKKASSAFKQTGIYSVGLLYSKPHDWRDEIGSGSLSIVAGRKGIITNWHVANMYIEKKVSILILAGKDKAINLAFNNIITLPPSNGANIQILLLLS